MSIYKSGTIIANLYDAKQGPHENRGLKGGMGEDCLSLKRRHPNAHFMGC